MVASIIMKKFLSILAKWLSTLWVLTLPIGTMISSELAHPNWEDSLHYCRYRPNPTYPLLPAKSDVSLATGQIRRIPWSEGQAT